MAMGLGRLCLFLLACIFVFHLAVPLLLVSARSPPSGFFDLFPNDTWIDRSAFPDNFSFGALTWAMKHEGAARADGKGDSVWDVYALVGGTVDGSIPNDGGNEYYRYAEDTQLLVDMGMDSFRFSIAWSRMIPNATGKVNQLAVDHYNDVIDTLLAAGIEPYVTLYEQDMPQYLQDSYGGLLSPLFIEDFAKYANVCFNAFGDRVKHWMTIDEGNDFVANGYAGIYNPPGRCTVGLAPSNCSAGNTSTEPYIASHTALLAHAAAVEVYRKYYQMDQKGEIGMPIWFVWYEPLSNSTSDIAAAQRAIDFSVGWYIEPVLYGDYPAVMREMLGSRLPTFTAEQSESLRGSVDFIGLNTATGIYATSDDESEPTNDYFEDMQVKITGYRDGVAIGRFDGEYSVPWCMEKIVSYMRTYYDNFPTYISALGYGLDAALDDVIRVEFMAQYMSFLLEGMREGADVRGLFIWSLIDGFEGYVGFDEVFGLYYVDENFDRYPRLSAQWFQNIISSNDTTLTLRTSKDVKFARKEQ